jgi:hypothetical protein
MVTHKVCNHKKRKNTVKSVIPASLTRLNPGLPDPASPYLYPYLHYLAGGVRRGVFFWPILTPCLTPYPPSLPLHNLFNLQRGKG